MTSFQAFTLSLIIHVVLTFVLGRLNMRHSEELPIPVEIEYRNSQEKPRKQMIEQTEVPLDKLLDVKTPEKEAEFLSEKTLRVTEQTRARLNAPTINLSNKAKSESNKKPRPDDEGFGQRKKNHGPEWSPGLSASDDAIPEQFRLGDFTVLNTDANLYYTFFARVKNQIRFRWISQIENIIGNVQGLRIRNRNQEEWNTQIEVILDAQGNFLNGSVMRESGLPAFDKAAILAFKQGSPFPNPPTEMIEQDGKIYLDYAFQVRWNPSYPLYR
ncbi:MAG: energy transducer TonB [Pseudomonadota bacterium]|nr:energy transducer TonB [Pseudomonadota bacterium]